MKICAIFLLSALIASQAAPIGKTSGNDVTDLFATAWEFQNKLTPRQEEIDTDVTEFRTSVSTVLKDSSKEALSAVEENALAILTLEAPVARAVGDLAPGECAANLKTLLNDVTGFTGFSSSNCVATYDTQVDAQVQTAQDMISVYDGVFTELQQLVVRAFVGKNKFTEQDAIIDEFQNEFETRVTAWEAIRPDVEKFVADLGGSIDEFNGSMTGCMMEVQSSVAFAYQMIQQRVQTCIDFENTPNPFRVAMQPLSIDDVLPAAMLSSFKKL